MKISKHDALVLAKLLVRVVDSSQPEDEKTQLDVDLEDLSERVDAYLTGDEEDECSDHCEDHKEEDEEDEEAEDDSDEEEDLDDEEVEEEDEEDEDLGEEEDEDDGDGDEELEADCFVTPQRLHDLKALKSEGTSVEFENRGDRQDSANVILDGFTEFTATHIRRKGKELHVREENGEWSVFPVSRFPSEWSATLPLNLLVGIER